MTAIHSDAERQGALIALTKSAPEVLLDHCGDELVGEDQAFDRRSPVGHP